MPREVVPIADLVARPPKGGRIRAGRQVARADGKGTRAAKLETFRFTSHDRSAIERLADLYGGTARPWNEPKVPGAQWEVITDTAEIRVALPPDPLGGTPMYELWGKGGRERYCDGIDCSTYVRTDDGVDMVDVPCVCAAEGVRSCKTTTRLSVLLPDVRFGGLWSIVTHSDKAAAELRGMADLIVELHTHGLVSAVLGLRPERQNLAGEVRSFMVPYLAIPHTLDELASGAARYRPAIDDEGRPLAELAAAEGERPAVGEAVHVGGHGPVSQEMLHDLGMAEPVRGREVEHTWAHRADVIDVELPPDEPETAPTPDDERAQAVNVSPTGLSVLAAEVFDAIGEAAPDKGVRGGVRTKGRTIERAKRAMVHGLTAGRATSTKDLRPDEARRMHERLEEIRAGVWRCEVDHDAEVVRFGRAERDGWAVEVPWEALG